jgi:hypothetical protein
MTLGFMEEEILNLRDEIERLRAALAEIAKDNDFYLNGIHAYQHVRIAITALAKEETK